MKWEYMTVMFSEAAPSLFGGKLDPEAFNGKLNALGGEGWELVAVFEADIAELQKTSIFAVFKRQVGSAAG